MCNGYRKKLSTNSRAQQGCGSYSSTCSVLHAAENHDVPRCTELCTPQQTCLWGGVIRTWSIWHVYIRRYPGTLHPAPTLHTKLTQTGTAVACAGRNAWFDRCSSSMVDSTRLIDGEREKPCPRQVNLQEQVCGALQQQYQFCPQLYLSAAVAVLYAYPLRTWWLFISGLALLLPRANPWGELYTSRSC